jgi:hypothetical protein
MLAKENATLRARMNADAGDLVCSGSVHDGVLSGRYQFTPNEGFRTEMASMDSMRSRRGSSWVF